MLRIVTRWAQYGTIEWEEWWTTKHGQQLGRVATPQEHVGFANFDLSYIGLPTLVPGNHGEFVLPLVPDDRKDAAIETLERHGFQVVRVEHV
jgi:hypothetical protein